MGTFAASAPGVFFYVTEPGNVYRSHDGGRGFTALEEGAAHVRGERARSVTVVTS